MKKLLPLLLSLVLFAVGCGDKKVSLEEREGLVYIKGSDTPYTGKHSIFYENGYELVEGNYKDGKLDGLGVEWDAKGQKKTEFLFKNGKEDGLQLMWHENGQKKSEENFKDGELISKKYWNSKGEEVATLKEAFK